MKKSIVLNALRYSLVAFLLAFALAPVPGHAQPSQNMTYQGYLTDGNGNALGATNSGPKAYDVVFRIWDVSTGGTTNDEVHAELQTVTVDNGYFSVLLGQGLKYQSEPFATPLSTIFTNIASARYIELTVQGIGVSGANVTILPRLQLVSAPYSFLAANAQNVTGTAVITSANIAPNTITAANIAPTTISAGNIAPNTITSAQITPNSISASSFATSIGVWTASGNNVYRSSGNVGIGTSSPATGLDILGTGTVGPGINSVAVALRARSTASYGSMISVDATQLSGGQEWQMFATGGNAGEGQGKLILRNGSAGIEPFTITSGGNVGINNISPGSSFSVGGTMDVSGMTTLNGAAHIMGGYVGINTVNPIAWLDVEGIATPSGGVSGPYFNTLGAGFGTFGPNTTEYVSIKSQWYVVGYGFIAQSDRRIKDIVGQSDAGKDLATIERLKVTDYRMIDRLAAGDKLHKGFIAQEVQEVIPEAVTKTKDYIPSVYAVADKLAFDKKAQTVRVSLTKAHDLKQGDKVRLIGDEGLLEKDVVAVPDDKTFVVSSFAKEPKRLFVYGKQVDDFLAVDYNRIFSTGIGAIQELAGRVEKLEAREAHIAALERKAAQVTTLEQEVAELKQIVAQLVKTGKATQQASLEAQQPIASVGVAH